MTRSRFCAASLALAFGALTAIPLAHAAAAIRRGAAAPQAAGARAQEPEREVRAAAEGPSRVPARTARRAASAAPAADPPHRERA